MTEMSTYDSTEPVITGAVVVGQCWNKIRTDIVSAALLIL